MSEALDYVRQVCAEFDLAHPHWRAEAEEDEKRRRERQKREIVQERERREGRKVEAASIDWAAVDKRIHEHLRNWLWKAIDERITQWWIDNGIDQRITQSWDIKCEPLKDGIGGALGHIRAQLRKEFRHGIEEAVDAVGVRLAALEATLEARLASHNETAWAAVVAQERNAVGEVQRLLEAKLVGLEERLRAVPGKLPAVKTYCPDTVHYAGHVVVHRGATYQALRDTARAPPHVDDWVCIASSGRDGQSVTVRGAFAVHKKYTRGDVIEHDGSSFVATRDNPARIHRITH